ncbi:MAG: NAD-dependent epimerase/dehydratase family protein [Rikenellaceae bacterium]|nr:NAD-dependent epimerase/dehydratase family protein [Rikenellaceae bacterium]
MTKIIKEYKNKYPKYSGIVYHPEITSETLKILNIFKYLPENKVPVLAVVGTSSKQGKFSAQLVIKNVLEKEGYNVGFFATEPQGELYGASFSFPYGHLSSVTIDPNESLDAVPIIMKGIETFNNPHIILAGTQSGLVPRSIKQQGMGKTELMNICVLSAMKPDGLICAINPDDSLETIENTLKVAKIYTKSEIIFMIMTPYKRTDEKGDLNFRKLEPLEYITAREKIIRHFNIPVIDIMDSQNEEFILNEIENFFS